MVADRTGQGAAHTPRATPRACGPAQQLRRVGPWLTMAAAVLAGACWDGAGPVVQDPGAQGPGLVSNPVAGVAPAAGLAGAPSGGALANVVYVSLPTDSVPSGEMAFVRNLRTGDAARAGMAEGGFDPVPVPAVAGDSLALDIQFDGGGVVHEVLVAPAFRKPRVVRTRPAGGKRDVVLNVAPHVVFTEPVNPATVSPETVRLLRNGVPVGGRVTLSGDGLGVTFQPDAPLQSNTDYTLAVAAGVHDLSGDALEQAVDVAFTTGGSTALAEAYTDPSALFVVNNYPALNGRLRTAEFYATLDDQGRVTGSFRLYYPEQASAIAGSISCLSIAGDTVWLAGVVNESAKPERIGKTIGWRAIDNGPSGSGAPDQLTLAYVDLTLIGFATAQDFCDSHFIDEVPPQEVDVGEIVVTGETLPPPPAPVPSGTLAFIHSDTLPSEGGMWVINADGTGLRTLTGSQEHILSPTWSPDGTRLAFIRMSVDPDTALFEFWDPDIYVMNADGSGATRLTFDAHSGDPAWSPDGRRIAFARQSGDGTGIYVMNADGSGVTRLTSNPCCQENRPTWSPDGSKIAFASQRDGRDYQIYVMNADGSQITRIESGPGQAVSPAWSPAGPQIAFVRFVDDKARLHVVNADGSGLRELSTVSEAYGPSWSPDGALIAFESGGPIYAVAVRGGQIIRITNGPGWDAQPAWCCRR